MTDLINASCPSGLDALGKLVAKVVNRVATPCSFFGPLSSAYDSDSGPGSTFEVWVLLRPDDQDQPSKRTSDLTIQIGRCRGDEIDRETVELTARKNSGDDIREAGAAAWELIRCRLETALEIARLINQLGEQP